MMGTKKKSTFNKTHYTNPEDELRMMLYAAEVAKSEFEKEEKEEDFMKDSFIENCF